MDDRCPRKLNRVPGKWCELAVMRLKAIRQAGKELSEQEEEKLPGCPWAVNHQLANYCFFKYIKDYAMDKPPTDVEIAALNCISVDTVKKTEKNGLLKIRAAEEFVNLKQSLDGDLVVEERYLDQDYKAHK